MSQYKKTDEIYIRSLRTGYIPHLGTYGPIVNPIKAPVSLCFDMIVDGVSLHQLDIETGKTMELTIANLFDADKFKTAKEAVEVEDEPEVIEETVVVGITAPASVVEEEPVVAEEEELPDETTVTSDTAVVDESVVPTEAAPHLTKAERKALAAANATVTETK